MPGWVGTSIPDFKGWSTMTATTSRVSPYQLIALNNVFDHGTTILWAGSSSWKSADKNVLPCSAYFSYLTFLPAARVYPSLITSVDLS